MPYRHDIQVEIQSSLDKVRRRYLSEVSRLSKRDTVLMAGNCNHNAGAINESDLQGWMAALQGLKDENLDVILHTPGGSSEFTEQIVSYIRSKYKSIRCIIPARAMSAGTMFACSCDEIIMSKIAAIGPIDPQYGLIQDNKLMFVPAYAILEDFKTALTQTSAAPNLTPFWAAHLSRLPVGTSAVCQALITRAQEIVEGWLNDYMKLPAPTSKTIAAWLGANHKSHGKPFSIVDAKDKGLNVKALEANQDFQDAVLSVFHATMIAFESTTCRKIIENQLGKGLCFNAP